MKTFINEMINNPVMKQIIDTIADGIFMINSSGKVIFWSKSMEQITGFLAEEAIGKTCGLLKICHLNGVRAIRINNPCEPLQGKSTGSRECFIRHRDGHDIPVIKTASCVRNEKEDIIGVIEAITDLTELEKTRKILAETAMRLERHGFDQIIGKSDCMQVVYMAIKATAARNAAILIQGESGTGKELVAGAIHNNSSRAKGPFIIVNCSALSESLLESELFGHAKGAFTGASFNRKGRFEQANHGTIFLDEIGELTPLVQVKLLRVLQEKSIERIGEGTPRNLDIRVITATHRDLNILVKEGRFREDLYYRLKVFPINIPPLRERKNDIPLLSKHFCDQMNVETGKKIKKISPEVMKRFLDYPWPGNVRELKNAIEHVFVLCSSSTILLDHLPHEIRTMAPPPFTKCTEDIQPVLSKPPQTVSRELLEKRLYESGWNKSEAARSLGLSRTTIWKWMKQWDIPLQKP